MRVFIKSLVNKSMELREKVKDGNLPEGEKELQRRLLTKTIKELHLTEMQYNKESLRLLKERTK